MELSDLMADPAFAEDVEAARANAVTLLAAQSEGTCLFANLGECDNQHVPNVALLRKVADQIVHQPESWDQGAWARVIFPSEDDPRIDTGKDWGGLCSSAVITPQTPLHDCQTAFCVAGWAVHLTGHPTLIFGTNNNMAGSSIDRRDAKGHYISIAAAAQHELGLSPQAAGLLFAGGNELYEVIGIMQAIANTVGESLF